MSVTRVSKKDGLSADLLEGAEAIAEFMFGDGSKRRKVYHLASNEKAANKLPVFRLGSLICARKSTLMEWIAVQECRDSEAGK
jgi:hypothetical protein